jgi:hypothetical protein
MLDFRTMVSGMMRTEAVLGIAAEGAQESEEVVVEPSPAPIGPSCAN